MEQAFHPPEPLVSVRELEVTYVTDQGDFRAVDNVSFDIGKSEIFGLAGESGCGKSTIAFAINRLHKPPALITHGEIHFDNLDLLKLSEREMGIIRWKEIAMVFQSAMNSLNPVLPVKEQFADVMRHHLGYSNEQARIRAEKLLDLVNIPPRDRLSDYPHQFSGGMRQRLVIAIALSLNPQTHHYGRTNNGARCCCSARNLATNLSTTQRVRFLCSFHHSRSCTHDPAM